MFAEYVPWMGVVAILALLIGVIDLVLHIFSLRYSLNDDDVKEIVKDSINEPNSRIHRAIETVADNAASKRVKNEMFYAGQKKEPVADTKSATQSAPAPAKASEEKPASVPETQKVDSAKEPVKEITLPKPVTLFAGSYMNGSFKRVSPTPDDRTIYTITAASEDAPEGVISIDLKAYDKLANTPDYMAGACIVSGNGSNVREVKSGTVKRENGQWIVAEQIEVELY